MKVLDFSKDLPLDGMTQYDEIASNSWKRLQPIFLKKYCSSDQELVKDVGVLLMAKLQLVHMVTNGNIEGKTFLDLGCGARRSKDRSGIYYEPWLCRALYELGAKPIGVDIAPRDPEAFEYHQVDLTKRSALSFLPDYSIDVASAHLFFDSPALGIHLLKYRMKGTALVNRITKQLERIVRPTGVFYYE